MSAQRDTSVSHMSWPIVGCLNQSLSFTNATLGRYHIDVNAVRFFARSNSRANTFKRMMSCGVGYKPSFFIASMSSMHIYDTMSYSPRVSGGNGASAFGHDDSSNQSPRF